MSMSLMSLVLDHPACARDLHQLPAQICHAPRFITLCHATLWHGKPWSCHGIAMVGMCWDVLGCVGMLFMSRKPSTFLRDVSEYPWHLLQAANYINKFGILQVQDVFAPASLETQIPQPLLVQHAHSDVHACPVFCQCATTIL